MSLRVVRLPFPATFQDLGRPGWLRFGVPRAGAFDYECLICGNRSLGNADGAPALEITLLGGAFETLSPCKVAVCGAQSTILVNEQEVGECCRFKPVIAELAAGARLEIEPAENGLRAYLHVLGGFEAEAVLGSVSGHAVRIGDTMQVGHTGNVESDYAPGADEPFEREGPIQIVPGPHATDEDLKTLTQALYTVTNHSNRVGIRLDGPSLTPQADRPSEPACIGAIQISNSGQPIVLGPDGPTIGGYPIVAVVKRSDQSLLGQLRPGQETSFWLS